MQGTTLVGSVLLWNSRRFSTCTTFLDSKPSITKQWGFFRSIVLLSSIVTHAVRTLEPFDAAPTWLLRFANHVGARVTGIVTPTDVFDYVLFSEIRWEGLVLMRLVVPIQLLQFGPSALHLYSSHEGDCSVFLLTQFVAHCMCSWHHNPKFIAVKVLKLRGNVDELNTIVVYLKTPWNKWNS